LENSVPKRLRSLGNHLRSFCVRTHLNVLSTLFNNVIYCLVFDEDKILLCLSVSVSVSVSVVDQGSKAKKCSFLGTIVQTLPQIQVRYILRWDRDKL
jgi:hypothetical protein